MAQLNIFGEWEYTEAELKEMKKKEAEEAAKKEAEAKALEEKKEAERKLKAEIKDKKKDIKDKLNRLMLDSAADSDNVMTELEAAKSQVDGMETLLDLDNLWQPFDAMYNAMVAEDKKREEEKKAKDEDAKAKKYKYPFLMYFGHEYRDVTGVFEDGKEYSEKQLTKTLIDHGYKDFKYAKEIVWEYFDDENCLYPKFQLGNRG